MKQSGMRGLVTPIIPGSASSSQATLLRGAGALDRIVRHGFVEGTAWANDSADYPRYRAATPS